MRFVVLAVTALLLPAPAPRKPTPRVAPNAAPVAATPTVDFTATAKRVARVYEGFGRVDDEMRWAPGLCRLPRPASARISTTPKGEPHGEKLYTVYAKDPAPWGYPKSAGPAWSLDDEQLRTMKSLNDIEQIIVKESWVPKKLTKEESLPGPFHRLQPVVRDGIHYGPGERSNLYLMFRLDPKTPDTDRGWVYATADPTGAITEAGAIEACVKCHRGVKSRIFGFPKRD